jgi:hypothetical protein
MIRRLIALTIVATISVVIACDEEQETIAPPPISGSAAGVVTVEGEPAAGISVALSSGQSVTTDDSGGYNFATVGAGTHAITISGFPSDVTFAATTQAGIISFAGDVLTFNFDGLRIRATATATATATPAPAITVSVTMSFSDGTGGCGTPTEFVDTLDVELWADGRIAITQPSTGDANTGVVAPDGSFTATQTAPPESYEGTINADGTGTAINRYTDSGGCESTWNVTW